MKTVIEAFPSLMNTTCHIKETETVQYSNRADFSLPDSTQYKNTYAFTYDNQGRLVSSDRYNGKELQLIAQTRLIDYGAGSMILPSPDGTEWIQ